MSSHLILLVLCAYYGVRACLPSRVYQEALLRLISQCPAMQGSVPFWPSVLSQLTGYTEASSPQFPSAIAHAGRLCSKLYTSAEAVAPVAPALP